MFLAWARQLSQNSKVAQPSRLRFKKLRKRDACATLSNRPAHFQDQQPQSNGNCSKIEPRRVIPGKGCINETSNAERLTPNAQGRKWIGRSALDVDLPSRAERAIHLAPISTRSIESCAVTYRGFPGKLTHEVPSWVEAGAIFHIRIRTDHDRNRTPLTDAALGHALLESARLYEMHQRWHITLFLLMPDHLHALLPFSPDRSMSRIIGDWKRFQTLERGVIWQENYFDHRLRNNDRGDQLEAKANYIRQNPVVAGLCARLEDWPWRLERED